MPNHASVTLAGHLGKNPETRTTPGGESVTSFSLATTVNRNRETERTTWWNCSAWGKRGETIANYLHKGDPLLVTGEPSLRKYQTQDGRDGVSLEVNAQGFSFLGGKDRDQSHQEPHSDAGGGEARQPPDRERQAASRAAQAPSGNPDFNDDIPF
jgi:single-strand DNA-binding protein